MKICIFFVQLAVLAALSSPALANGFKILDHIKVPDGGYDYVAFDSARARVYVTRPDYANVIDVKTGSVSRLESVPGGHMLLAIPGTSLGLVPQRKGTIRLVDLTADTVVADLPGGSDPDAAAYDPVSKLAFVVNKGSGEATAVDPAARKVVATIPIGGVLQFPVSDGKGHVFVNVASVPEVAVIDVKSMKVTGRYKLDGCQGVSGLAYARQGALLISGCLNGLAKVLRASDGQEVASLTIGRGADAAFYDPRHQLAFLPCGTDGVLEVISLADPKRPAILQHVQTLPGTRTGAVDPKTGRVYLMTSKPDLAATIPPGGRPPRLAGSFEVLVIGR